MLSQLVVVGAIVYTRGRLTIETKALAVYFMVSFVLTMIQLFLALNGINNLWTGQIFIPIQFTLIMYVFYAWNRRSYAGMIMSYSILAFDAAWLLSVLWSRNLADVYTYADPISAAIFILTSSYTLLRIDRIEGTPLLSMPAFWVSSATIIYFGSTIVLSSLSAALWRAPISTMQLAWSIQAVMNILANLLYAGGFLCLRQKT
jgi:hypothetical protein